MSVSKILRIGALVLMFVVGVITIATAAFFHFNSMCGEEASIEKTSPDGLYVAQLMLRNCGATTPYVIHINIRTARSRFHPDFWSGAIYEGQVFTSPKYSATNFCWSKPHRLSIGYPDLPMHNWGDVMIDDDFRNAECQ